MSRGKFEGKVVVITGSARGQGKSHALGFAREGAEVVVNDVCRNASSVPYPLASERELDGTVDEIKTMGGRVLGIKADVGIEVDAKRLVDTTIREFGHLDILINNAGIANVSSIHEMSLGVWEETLRTNLTGVFLVSKHAVPHMIKRSWGRIISTASQLGLVGHPDLVHYCASKAGVIGFTKALALELAPHQITVNAVCPTVVDTMQASGLLKAYPKWAERVFSLTGPQYLFPDGDKLQPVDITNAMLWLASDEAKHVTGIALQVDAGSLAK